MYEDIELNTFHDLSTTVERLPPLKIAVADATAKHLIEGGALPAFAPHTRRVPSFQL